MADETPLVSIAIPAYNHAQYLEQAIRSVLDQDYPSTELIVLDDGSTDATPEVLSRFGSRFHWERQQNIGQAATLNKAWRMAKGDLLGYLSADDYLMPGAITRLVRALRAQPRAVVAYCDFDLVDPSGTIVRHVQAADFSIEHMLLHLACPPGPGALFRRSAFESSGGWNTRLQLMADFDYWLRLATRGTFVHVAETLAAWRVHPASQSFGAVSEDKALEPVRIVEAFFVALAPNSTLQRLALRSRARAHLVGAQLHARSARYFAALRSAAEACRLHPAIAFHPATWRLVLNALVNQPAHRLLWKLRRGSGR